MPLLAPPPPVNSRPRAKTCFCRCWSHCTVWNPDSSSNEGGQQVTWSTHLRHLLDDQVCAAQEKATSPSGWRSCTNARPRPDLDCDPNDLNNADNRWMLLIKREVDWLSGLPLSTRELLLVFLNNPMDHTEYIWPLTTSIIRPNQGHYALKTTARANVTLLEVESCLCELISYLSTLKHSDVSIAFEDRLYQEIYRVNREKEIQWSQQCRRVIEGKIVVNTSMYRHVHPFKAIIDYFPSPSPPEVHFCPRGPCNKIVKAASIMSLVLGNLFFTPRWALRIHLAGLCSLLRVSGTPPETIEKIPKDPRTIYSYFCLNLMVHQFLSCTKCHCLYSYGPGNHSQGDPDIDMLEDHRPLIMSKCLYQQTPESQPCNTPL